MSAWVCMCAEAEGGALCPWTRVDTFDAHPHGVAALIACIPSPAAKPSLASLGRDGTLMVSRRPHAHTHTLAGLLLLTSRVCVRVACRCGQCPSDSSNSAFPLPLILAFPRDQCSLLLWNLCKMPHQRFDEVVVCASDAALGWFTLSHLMRGCGCRPLSHHDRMAPAHTLGTKGTR